ncbi:mechanosensitive ion channel domain-containing protein [Flammeovirga pacifica]|uniref:Mechanosensitive ion channel MscS domain-containing protein n=1 Tax=Flammeovirga pacifica TaxID=915059 RepID=A0A1S1Z2G8_FLAPC|nr:mechanosensitive ion channel domain-containing protein [Flammeovirga pacifica]OHX67460.1 hypothetical protein NH26_14455 [Flammeovirga pacifica]
MNQYFHNISLDIGNILSTLLIIVLAIGLKLGFLRLLEKNNKGQSGFHSRRKILISKIVNVGIVAFCILLVLGVWEVKPEDLAIYFTSIFTIIGVAFFAQWSHLSNITAGVILFMTSPLKIGDNIVVYEGEKLRGVITDLGLFFITIITEENQKLMLTNTFFLQKMWSVKLTNVK